MEAIRAPRKFSGNGGHVRLRDGGAICPDSHDRIDRLVLAALEILRALLGVNGAAGPGMVVPGWDGGEDRRDCLGQSSRAKKQARLAGDYFRRLRISPVRRAARYAPAPGLAPISRVFAYISPPSTHGS